MAGQGGLAEEIRAGLEQAPQAPLKLSAARDPLDELWFRKPVRRHIYEFGIVLGCVLLILAGFSFYRRAFDTGLGLMLAAALLCLLARRVPRLMQPVWRGFIQLGELLGTAVTFAVLFLTWAVALIPIALGMKVFGARVMDMTFRAPVQSYWEERDPAKDDFKFLERQY